MSLVGKWEEGVEWRERVTVQPAPLDMLRPGRFNFAACFVLLTCDPVWDRESDE